MTLMTYEEREALKHSPYGGMDCDRAQDYSHWHRFLEGVYYRGKPALRGAGSVYVFGPTEPVEVPDDVYPDFETYRAWVREYPGWSYGRMDRWHAAWKPEYANRVPPMNELYERMANKRRRTKR